MIALVVIMVLLGLLLAALLWAGGGKTVHESHGSGIIESVPDALEREPAATGTLVVLTYALAYGLGEQHSSAPASEAASIYDWLDHLVETIAASGADVAVLQEVDFASQRTHDIDQLHYIAAALGWGFAARAITWECRYLPYPVWPLGQPTGRVRAGMGVISRYALVQNTRQRLPQERAVPVLAPLFCPHPTVQMVDVQCGTQTLRLFNVHLGANDVAARQRQARRLVEFVRQAETPVSVLMGTFNAALPGTAGESSVMSPASEQTLRLIVDELQGRFRAVTDDELSAQATAARASVPPILVGSGVRAVETRIMPLHAPLSAHLPLVVHLRWALPLVISNGSSHHERR
jgi:endonuclease/exonuclease/phosphatase family metal-dependent hydrolase